MKNAIALIGLLLGMGMFVTGCESSGSGTAVNQDELIGRWDFTSLKLHTVYQVTVNGKTQTSNMDTTKSLADQGNFIQFNQDLTCSANVPYELIGLMAKRSAAALGAPLTGTWSLAAGVVTLVSTNKQDTLAFGASVSGTSGSFTITAEDSGNEEGYVYKSTMTGTISSTKVAAK